MEQISLEEVRAVTYKPKDSWWTVFLVDPYASRLVRLVANYRWVTPNRLTIAGTILGFAAAACFGVGDWAWLVVGALLFHLSFVVDCMDGKLARLQGSGSVFGSWLDYIFDRFRVLVCALALMGAQYRATDRQIYLWLAFGVVVVDMFHYLNLLQMSKVRRDMRVQLDAARGVQSTEDTYVPPPKAAAQTSLYLRVRGLLVNNRIRPRVVSGIEFQMLIFIVAPLIGPAAIIPVTLLIGALILFFEVWQVYRLWQAHQSFTRQLATLERSQHQDPDVDLVALL